MGEVEIDVARSNESGNNGSGAPAEKEPENGQRSPWAKRILLAVVVLGLVVGLIFGIRYLIFVRSHASTDDAYLTSDVIQISPQVSGTVQQVLVEDNQLVNKGQLLVTLDDSTYRANVTQARANLNVAIAQAQGAGVSVSLTQQTGSAQVTQAQGGLSQARSGIGSAKSAVSQAQAALSASVANQKRSNAAVNAAQAAVSTARANVSSAKAAVASAEATYENAEREARRFTTLASQGAEAQERAETAVTTARAAKAALDSAHQQVSAAEAVVSAKQADLAAAREQVGASAAAVQQARAQVVAAQQGVSQAVAREQQAAGQLSQAQTVPTQVAVSKTAQSQALAKVQQARAALQNAELQLSYTRIYAPNDGRVSKKNVEVGELVQPGTPLMALIPPSDIWVVANFKETQLHGIRKGNDADINVDAIPGRTFTGRVDSIAAGTGSTFALLPPENATGNFVKVVQRVPVKIVFDRNQPDLDRLRTGMSVTAVVSTK